MPRELLDMTYKFGTGLMAFIFVILFPTAILSPSIFDGVPISALGSTAVMLAVGSALIGIWYTVASLELRRKQREVASQLLQGMDLSILVVPYVIYVGTKSFIQSRMARE